MSLTLTDAQAVFLNMTAAELRELAQKRREAIKTSTFHTLFDSLMSEIMKTVVFPIRWTFGDCFEKDYIKPIYQDILAIVTEEIIPRLQKMGFTVIFSTSFLTIT